MVGLLLVLALASAPASQPAPAAAPLELGGTVRVELVESANRPSQLKGRLIGLSADSLTLRSEEKVWQIPWTDVRDVQRQQRQRPRLVLRGAALGLLTGAVVGMSAAVIYNHGSSCSSGSFLCFTDHEAAVTGGILGGAAGLAIGSAMAVRTPGRWDEALPSAMAEPAVALLPVRRGLRLQVRLRF